MMWTTPCATLWTLFMMQFMSLRFDVSMRCTSIEVQARTASQGEMAVKASGLGYTFAGAKRSAVIYRGNTVTFVYYTE